MKIVVVVLVLVLEHIAEYDDENNDEESASSDVSACSEDLKAGRIASSAASLLLIMLNLCPHRETLILEVLQFPLR